MEDSLRFAPQDRRVVGVILSPAVRVERHDEPLFPPGEYAGRVARVRERMAAEAIDACLVLGPDSQLWLCGLESFVSGVLSQALLVPADERQSMTLVMWEADVPLARDSTVVDDIRGYRFGVDDPVEAFAAVIAERVPEARTIGLDSSSRAVPHALGSRLSAHYETAEWVDSTALLGEARLLKSPLELSYLRRAGQYADAGLAAARKCARPGVSERGVAAEIEYAMRRAGSDYPSIPTELTSGPRSVFVHGTPGHRRLEPGDLVHIEIGGVEARYNAVGLQTICVGGAQPSAVGVCLYDVAVACLRAGLEAISPGIEAHEVEAPALAILREAGLGDGFKMRFGYGVGIGYPPTWLDPFEITRRSTQRLLPGTTFVLHACLLDEPARIGVVVGGTFAMGDDRVEQIAGAGAVELLTV